MRQLTSLDAQFLAIEDGRAHGHVSGLAIYGSPGSLDAAAIRSLIAERIHLLPPFRWRLATVPLGHDHPYWVEDDTFDLEFHVRELALPAPGDDHQLAEQVARIVARPLDRARPLWELYVIHGLRDDRVALLTKMHHAAIDGMSGAEVLSVLLDTAPTGRDIPPAGESGGEVRTPGELGMLARGVAGLPRQPLRAVAAVPRALPHLDSVAMLRHVPGVGTTAAISRRVARLSPRRRDGGVLQGATLTAPRTRFQGAISPHRRVAFGSLPLADVKAVKNAAGCTVNDVVMTLCAGALRDWLAERDELPADPLLTMVPVSVRTEAQRGTFGNRISTMVVPLATDEREPALRLQRMQDANHFIPPALLARAARVTSRVAVSNHLKAPVNLVISNVPGSPVPLYCAGARLQAQYPISAIVDGVGLNITVLSYEDRLDFGVVADRAMLDDPWELIERLRTSLAELLELVPVARELARAQAGEAAGLAREMRLIGVAREQAGAGEPDLRGRKRAHEALEAQHALQDLRPVADVLREAPLQRALGDERARGGLRDRR
jgi:WS/DGAT/MGAT family acyltransferase